MVRRERTRKTAACKVIDMRARRLQKGIPTNALADLLQCADAKHVCSIETGYCSITMEKAVRGAYALDALIVYLDGVGGAIVLPFDTRQMDAPMPAAGDMRPGEAAWNVLEEYREAIEHVPNLQSMISRDERQAVVGIVEQVIFDPWHAGQLLLATIRKMDPTIEAEATVNHGRKMVRKGFMPFLGRSPLDAA